MEDELILTATEAKNRLIRGELSARELLEHCVARINAYEPQVEALAYWNLDDARRNADACDARKERGILAGLPLGVKDIIDVSNMPSRIPSCQHVCSGVLSMNHSLKTHNMFTNLHQTCIEFPSGVQ